MENNTNQLTQAFETEVCGRCGGSGHYSYCQMYGTTCFGCRGKGKILSKRGVAASQYARSLRTVKASDVQVGWLLFEQAGPLGGKTGWFPVTAAGFGNSYSIAQDGTRTPHYDLTTDQCIHGMWPDSTVQAVPNKDRLREIRALALAYQATLTKKGTVMKRAAKAQTSQEAAAHLIPDSQCPVVSAADAEIMAREAAAVEVR